MNWLKNVLKDTAKVYPRDLIREYRHRSVLEVERTNVVQAENVIDVTMSYQDRVEPIDLCPERLLTKIYRRIDQDLFIVVFDKD